ncbi:growth-regulating factor 4-like isoform X2 [Vitis riparia]|uniref:growth-regulating factor 4-like isoform X2 n=1 Tax=Vitis riparia TaxID=96939 RepID=UPI00155A8089|nr:growth-regulating factor 4-like isoform X2 [Vitis riparia]
MEAQPLRWTSWDTASPSIKLGLGIGVGSGQSTVIKQRKSGFTPAQLRELEQQSLISKYMVAGLPVPVHLVLPIWKSVASSFGSTDGGIYKQYPSFIGFSPQGFDCRNVMDPEPGRCRRTDGKKWRCSKDVVPDQKYCERHMHRGRQRSRKPVEAPAIASHVTRPTFNSSMESESSKTDLTIAVPLSLQLMAPSSNNTSTGNNTATTTTTTTTTTTNNNNSNQRENNFSGNKQTSAATATAISDKERNYFNGNKNFNTTSLALAAITKNESSNNANDSKDFTTIMNMAVSTTSSKNSKRKRTDNMDEENGRNRASDNNINRSRNNGNNNNVGSNVSPGLDFSPKSVLQVMGCSSSCFDYRNYAEPEPGRCRRTDGKKWRCSRDVVPDQKYCVRHMHRGAKKHVGVSQSVAVSAAIHSNCRPPTIPNKTRISINLNTNLSISIPANPQTISHDGESPTASSSSETTITN